MFYSISVGTSRRCQMLDITAQVQEVVKTSKVKDGMCLVFVPHTTAGVTINENADSSVQRDILSYLNQLVPKSSAFEHAEGNSDSHIKTSMMGNSTKVIINNNMLLLGTWQGIFFCEFDGPRTRKVFVKVVEG